MYFGKIILQKEQDENRMHLMHDVHRRNIPSYGLYIMLFFENNKLKLTYQSVSVYLVIAVIYKLGYLIKLNHLGVR